MARCIPGGLEVEPDGASRQDIGGVVERCFCGVGTKSEIAACRAHYLVLLDPEFFEDGLFLLEMDSLLDFCFFLLLSDELSLSDSAAESFDFLVALLVEGAFFFVDGARGAPWYFLLRTCRSIAGGER
jgi:hypothetical protein